jgi:hypothetical protein
MKRFISKLLPAVILALISSIATATTWDEPWQDQVIKQADCFVLAEIIVCDGAKSATISIEKTLAGKQLSGKIKITDYYLLHLGSYSYTSELDFAFNKANSYYFFIKKDSAGNYCLATPTSGYAMLEKDKVYATYRHSYHQALVDADVYEKTMTSIFNNYHGLPYDKAYIEAFVKKYLSMKPSGFEKDEMETFFNQHVALECIYHLKMGGYYEQILPFLHDTTNFHNEVSAARALRAYNTPECKQQLMHVISDTTIEGFIRVICLWTISEFKPTELKEDMTKLVANASVKESGFGGDIMDPRVGTRFPNVKEALEELIAKL